MLDKLILHSTIVLLLLTAAPATGSAQDRFNLQEFRPTTAPRTGFVVTHGAQTEGAGLFEFHAVGSFGWSPFALITSTDAVAGRLVKYVGAADLVGSVGIGSIFDIGFDVPLFFMGEGDSIQGFRTQPLEENTVAIGDPRIVPRVTLYSQRDEETATGAALALVADIAVPVGDVDAYAGDNGFRADPKAAFDYVFGGGYRIGVNAGYRVRPVTGLGDVTVGDAITTSIAGDIPLVSDLHLIADVASAISLASEGLGAEEIPVEGWLAFRWAAARFMAQVGGGGGFSEGVGAADWRLFASTGYTHDGPRDNDGDGYANRHDSCRDEAEDYDQFDDLDGCPDPDNDNDGVLDPDDQCVEPEDRDDYEDTDGCPDLDDDNDQIADASDACRLEPEDRDGFEDDDGCPELDNDGDGFADPADLCPLVAGAVDGCPAGGNQRIEIPAVAVYFELADSMLDAVDRDELVRFVDALGPLNGRTIVVEGHTDERGSDESNLSLSMRRARNVRDALVGLGIHESAITTEGYGDTRPAAPGDDDNARARNRRVEVRIVN